MPRSRKTATKAKATSKRKPAAKSKAKSKSAKKTTSGNTRGRASQYAGKNFVLGKGEPREGSLPHFVQSLISGKRGKKQMGYDDLVAGVEKGWKQPRTGEKADTAFAKSCVNHVAKNGFIKAA